MKVVILGLGQFPQGSGVSAAEFFAHRGDLVTVLDFYYTPAMDANVKRLKKFKSVKFIFQKHELKALKGADLVVKHQRIRMDEPEVVEAKRLGIPIESELSIFLKHCPALVVGITGTRGKSTTTTLIYEMLKAGVGNRRVWLGGNISISPLTFLAKIKPRDLVVLEMSSFQLEGTVHSGISPQVAVWTNLMRDHLNAYPAMEDYAEAKAQIFRQQKPSEIVFLPASRQFDDYAKQAPGQVYRFGKKGSVESRLVARTKLKLVGEHNARNAEMAAAVALHFGVASAVIQRVLRAFKGLPNRLEVIALRKGVRFVNDTTATTPDATIAAVRALAETSKSIHLIAGGADKSLDFTGLAKELKKQGVCLSLFPGTAHDKFADAVYKSRVKFNDVPNMNAAVAYHLAHVKKGDVILLSPSCASFGLFQNEFDRGEQFVKIVKKAEF